MTVLAHGGGVPEAAMIGLPLLLFGVFFGLERRARRRDAARAERSEGTLPLDDPGSGPHDRPV